MTRGPMWAATAAVAAAAAWFLWKPSTSAGPEGGPESPLAVEGADGPDAASGGGPAGASLAKGDAARAGGKGRGEGVPRGVAGVVGVVSRDGAPVAARVELSHVGDVPSRRGWSYQEWMTRLFQMPANPAPFATTRSGGDGRFAFGGVGVGQFRVVARAEDGARGQVEVTVPVDGARVEANPAIAGGGERLAGRVVHADGRAFQGSVSVDPVGPRYGFTGGVANAVAVDADGRFEATGLAKGQFAVTAIEAGVLRATSVPIPIPYAGEFTFTVDAGALTIAGRVVADDGGAPVPGAAVLSNSQGGLVATYAVQATADADGRFTLAVPPGRYLSVSARAPGFAIAYRQEVDPTSAVEVRLVKAARVGGRVATAEGTGVEGLTVQAVTLSRNGGPAAEAAVSGAGGAYALDDLAPGEAMVVAEGKGWATKGADAVRDGGFNPLAITLRPGETTACDVVVVRGATVVGFVRDADGTAVPGAVVRAEPGGGGRYGYGRGGASSNVAPTAVAATGADGAFTLEGLPVGGSFVIAASVAERAIARSESVTTDAAIPAKVEIRLAADRRIEAVVVEEPGGAPVPGVQVRASGAGGPATWQGAAFALTGTDGKALVGPVGPGALSVTATREGWVAPAAQSVADGAATPLTFRVSRGLSVSGRVTMPDKTPATGMHLVVQLEGERWARRDTATGADGTFTVGGLAKGTYRITAEGARGADGAALFGSAVVTAGDGPVTVELSTNGAAASRRLAVRVLDPDGRPVPRAHLLFRSTQGGSNGTDVQDGRSSLELDRDDPGTLTVWGATSVAGTPLPYAPKTVTDVKPSGGEVVVRLDPGRSLAGTVRGPDGQGVRGAMVSASATTDAAQRRRGWGGGDALSSARTDAGGAFRLDGLGPDEVSVTVDVPPEFLAPEAVVARPGAAGLDLVLKAATSNAVTVLDWLERPVVGASVSVRAAQKQGDDARRRRESSYDPGGGGMTDARGVAQIGGLDPAGRFDVTVNPPEARDDLQSGALTDVPAGDRTVHLERGYALEVRVVDLGGKPVTGAQLQRKTGEHSWSGSDNERTAPGTFRLRRLPAGELTLVAAMPGVPAEGPGADPRAGRVTTSADAGSVTIRIDPGLDLIVRVEGAASRSWWNAQLIEEGAERGRGVRPVSGEGDLRWYGLKPGSTYSLWIPPEPGAALSCWRHGLHGGGDLTVTLEKGGSITGRLAAPAGATRLSVHARAASGLDAQGTVDAEGRYEIGGLPDGLTWRVSGSGLVGDAWMVAQSPGEVAAGSSLDLKLEKRPER